jgi:signal transduction histidine kinase
LVTRRFYRCRRNQGKAGTGLGLGVLEAVARLHEGGLSLRDNHPGLIATLRLPAASPGSGGIPNPGLDAMASEAVPAMR